jgi:hypothetical protein
MTSPNTQGIAATVNTAQMALLKRKFQIKSLGMNKYVIFE